ncbi:transketolase family protein [Saccharopolyspora sp. NPDC000995]
MTSAQLLDCVSAFAGELLRLADEDDRVCIVNNDSADTHLANDFQREFPARFVDVGIAEQNMAGVAAGLANAGKVPFVHSAACFLARATEQIKNAAYTGANVKFCGFVSGLAYGALGGTHHATEDIAWMRSIPDLPVLCPATPAETAAAARLAWRHEGPVYLRIISKTPVPELFDARHEISFGTSTQLREGGDVTLIGTGLTTTRLVEAAALLESEGVRAGVLHLHSVSPIDEAAIMRAARETGRLVVAEDHVLNGGLGGAVSETVVRTVPVPVLQLGITNTFAPIGPAAFLHEHFRLTGPLLARDVRDWLDGHEQRRA